MMRVLLLFVLAISIINASVILRNKRQTFKYDEELMRYAHPHPGTKVQHGYLARYAPQDWPKWYSRTMMKWDGMSVMSPYDRNDARYPGWAADYVRRAGN